MLRASRYEPALSRRQTALEFAQATREQPTGSRLRIANLLIRSTSWLSRSAKPYFFKPQSFQEGKGYYSTGVKRIPEETSQKVLVAFNLDTNSISWKYPQVGAGRSSGGTMTTASGLLFFGDDAGSLEAADARSGKPLWHFDMGQEISASPMSYAIAGKQYVAIAAGSDVFSFALP